MEKTDIFAKLSPLQKVRIVKALKSNGHTTGFLGDGINDAGAMKASDVGISVDTAVDIARESADIILLEKDLMVLEEGVVEGRKTYANIIKYIKMTASSNFGNMFSVLAASIFLPMLPMLPMQLLVLNLIYDISCTAIPWDNVDPEYLKTPRKWDASSIVKFMLWMGPASSVFDITTYLFLFFYLCPMVFGGAFHTLGQTAQIGFIALFHTGWFLESLWTQTLVIHMIRSPKLPFIGSQASWQLDRVNHSGDCSRYDFALYLHRGGARYGTASGNVLSISLYHRATVYGSGNNVEKNIYTSLWRTALTILGTCVSEIACTGFYIRKTAIVSRHIK